MAASCDGLGSDTEIGNLRRSRPSKRIDAARFFLKNISLDGKTVDGVSRWKERGVTGDSVAASSLGPSANGALSAVEDDERLISDLPTNSKVQLHHSTSVACTNVYRENCQHLQTVGESTSWASRSQSYIETSVVSGAPTKDAQFNKISQQELRIRFVDSKQFLSRNVKYMSGKRALLISTHGLPIGSFSVMPYKKEDKHAQQVKEKRVSSGPTQTSSSTITIDGVEIGDAKRTVSYSHMLVPGLSRRTRLTNQSELPDDHIQSKDHSASVGEVLYHPFLLDDPELMSGKHRKVLNLKSYTVSVIQYAKSSEIKKDINERFKEKFPNTNITLSKLRSIKLEMFDVGMKCGVGKATIACAHVYFEKLVLREKITKVNRKCCAGACLLLASKFNGDIKKGSFSPIIETINDRFRLHLKDLLACELLVLIALKFQLCLPPSEVIPMYKRLETMRSIVKSRSRHSHRSQYSSRNNHHRDNK